MGISNQASGLKPGVCTSTTRPSTPYEGMMIYETDTNRVLVYDNAAWVMIADTDAPPGLQKIIPTSVSGTGASIDSTGNVVVSSGGTNFTINGCFTSEFSNYKFVVRDFKSSNSTALYCALGTSNTGSDHRYAGVYVNSGGSVAGIGTSAASRFELPCIGRGTTISTGCEFTLVGPYKTEETTFFGMGVDSDTGAIYRSNSGINLSNTSFSAVYFSTDQGYTITSCNVSIYAYRD